MFTHFNKIQECDGRIDGQTPNDGIGCATHSVARQKSGIGPYWSNNVHPVPTTVFTT